MKTLKKGYAVREWINNINQVKSLFHKQPQPRMCQDRQPIKEKKWVHKRTERLQRETLGDKALMSW